MDRAAVLGMQSELTLTLPPCGLKNCWRCTAAGSPSEELPTKSQFLSTRLIPGKAGGWLPSTGSRQQFTAGHFPPVPSPAASVLQQLVFYSRALRTEVNKESPSCRTSTQLTQIIVMGPLHAAPPLNLVFFLQARQKHGFLYCDVPVNQTHGQNQRFQLGDYIFYTWKGITQNKQDSGLFSAALQQHLHML